MLASKRGSPPPCAPRLTRRIAAAGLLALVVTWGQPTDAREAPSSFADLAEKLAPAVVNISTTQQLPRRGGPEIPQFPPGSPFEEFFREFFGERGAPNGAPNTPPRGIQSLGSGFIIDSAGFVVTNNHVVAEASEIKVILQDDTNLKAELVGRDPVTDLALLKVEAGRPLPSAGWGDSAASRVGDWVLAIGNPFGLGGTVTAGILSARARDINAGPYDDFLQTDASINRGNSGGPMFNMNGEVIGINTAIYSPSGGSIGIGFAIPSNLAKSVIEQIRTNGRVERGWLGVRIQPVNEEIAESLGLEKPRGALVADVDPTGPAAKAKIQPGDVILTFDGKAVDRTRELPRIVAETPVNKAVKVTLWRDGKEVATEATVGLLSPERVGAVRPEQRNGAPNRRQTTGALGLELAPLTPELKREFEVGENAKGALVVEVDENSAAAQRGLRPGDVIAGVGQDPVSSPQQVVEKVEAARKAGKKSVLMRVEREGTGRFVSVPIG